VLNHNYIGTDHLLLGCCARRRGWQRRCLSRSTSRSSRGLGGDTGVYLAGDDVSWTGGWTEARAPDSAQRRVRGRDSARRQLPTWFPARAEPEPLQLLSDSSPGARARAILRRPGRRSTAGGDCGCEPGRRRRRPGRTAAIRRRPHAVLSLACHRGAVVAQDIVCEPTSRRAARSGPRHDLASLSRVNNQARQTELRVGVRASSRGPGRVVACDRRKLVALEFLTTPFGRPTCPAGTWKVRAALLYRQLQAGAALTGVIRALGADSLLPSLHHNSNSLLPGARGGQSDGNL
jgi:hypothetical protein